MAMLTVTRHNERFSQMALQLFNEDDSTDKTILVVARNGLNGEHITKELRAIVKLRTALEWMDDKVGIANFPIFSRLIQSKSKPLAG